MKKIIIGSVVLAVALFMGLNLFGAMAVGHILENAIGAPVSVERLHVGIFSSSVGLYHVKIENPKGFREKTLADIHEVLGNRPVVIARELTKKFEEVLRGEAGTLLKSLENRAIKGEITLIVEGNSDEK